MRLYESDDAREEKWLYVPCIWQCIEKANIAYLTEILEYVRDREKELYAFFPRGSTSSKQLLVVPVKLPRQYFRGLSELVKFAMSRRFVLGPSNAFAVLRSVFVGEWTGIL